MSSPTTVAVVHFPSGGHIRPLQPLVTALGERGLRTVQYAPAEWEQTCLSSGGEFRALPDLSDLAWPSPIPAQIARFIGGLGERLAPWTIEQVKEIGASVVLRDTFAQYGRYAARANGVGEIAVPAMMAFHRGMRPSAADIPSSVKNLVKGVPDALALRRISKRMAARYGPPLGGPLEVFAGRQGATTLVFTVPALQLRPEGLRGEDVRFVGPMRALGGSEDALEPALEGVGPDDRLIYVSLGTVFELRPQFFRDAARALAGPGRRVILSIGRLPAQELGPLPEGVSAHASLDQVAVLRRSDLFVTHAGFNGVQEGLAAGVPLLLHPQMFEQALNADVVVGLGAGLRIDSASEGEIRRAAERMLDEGGYAEAAGRVAGAMRDGLRVEAAVEAVVEAAGGEAVDSG